MGSRVAQRAHPHADRDQRPIVTRSVTAQGWACRTHATPMSVPTSALDGPRDLQGGLAGCEVRGVDDLGLAEQPGAGRLGVRVEVLETE